MHAKATTCDDILMKVASDYVKQSGKNQDQIKKEFESCDLLAKKILKFKVPKIRHTLNFHIPTGLIAEFYQGAPNNVWQYIEHSFRQLQSCNSDRQVEIIARELRKCARISAFHEEQSMREYGDYYTLWAFSNYINSDSFSKELKADASLYRDDADVLAIYALKEMRNSAKEYAVSRLILDAYFEEEKIQTESVAMRSKRCYGVQIDRKMAELLIEETKLDIDRSKQNIALLLNGAHSGYSDESFDVKGFSQLTSDDLLSIDKPEEASELIKTLSNWQYQIKLDAGERHDDKIRQIEYK